MTLFVVVAGSVISLFCQVSRECGKFVCCLECYSLRYIMSAGARVQCPAVPEMARAKMPTNLSGVGVDAVELCDVKGNPAMDFSQSGEKGSRIRSMKHVSGALRPR